MYALIRLEKTRCVCVYVQVLFHNYFECIKTGCSFNSSSLKPFLLIVVCSTMHQHLHTQ